jgi:hypothetical protein
MNKLTRRSTLLGAGGLALASASPLARAAMEKLDLENPAERARMRAKVVASAASETVYTFYRLHIYAYMHSGNLMPLYTMNNLNVRVCKPNDDDTYDFMTYETGAYCRFDTDEMIDHWQNPVTGDRREVWPFVGGPFNVRIAADGVETGPGATLKPKALRMEVIGDMLFVPTASHFSFPSSFDPEIWPDESPGETHYWDSLFVHGARVDEATDPTRDRVPAFCQFQNLVSWGGWIGMGGHEGRSYGRAYGTKLDSVDDIPAGARHSLEQQTPEIFDIDSWTGFRDGDAEYKASRESGQAD